MLALEELVKKDGFDLQLKTRDVFGRNGLTSGAVVSMKSSIHLLVVFSFIFGKDHLDI